MKKKHQSKNTVLLLVSAVVVAIVALIHFLPGRSAKPTQVDSVSTSLPSPTPAADYSPAVPYRSLVTSTHTPAAELAAEVGAKNVAIVLAFNRLDAQHIPKDAVLTIPANLDWDTLSPFPSDLPMARDIPKLLLVSQRVQAFGAYEAGALVRWGPVSTGKSSTPTPSKLYFTNWKGKLVVSSIEDEWVMPWYFNLDNLEGVSMHQYALPGYPASHACVRMLEADAEWMYDWANQWILAADGQTELASGTPVLVFGQYAYGKTAPWKKLPDDPTAATLTVDELSTLITADLPTIQQKAQERLTIGSTR